MKKYAFLFILMLLGANLSAWAESSIYNRAVDAFNKGQQGEALELLMKVVEEEPTNGYAWAYLAAIKRDRQEYEDAQEAANLALECLPEEAAAFAAWTRNELAHILVAQADTAGAIDQLTRCIEAVPDDLDYRYYRASLEQAVNRLDEAEQDYRYLAERDSVNLTGWLGLGCVLGAKGKPAEAIEAFNKTIVGQNTDHSSYSYRATEFFNLGLYEDAMDDVIRSLERKPQDNIHAEWVLRHIANVAKETAIQKLNDQRIADPEHGEYWSNLMLSIGSK